MVDHIWIIENYTDGHIHSIHKTKDGAKKHLDMLFKEFYVDDPDCNEDEYKIAQMSDEYSVINGPYGSDILMYRFDLDE